MRAPETNAGLQAWFGYGLHHDEVWALRKAEDPNAPEPSAKELAARERVSLATAQGVLNWWRKVGKTQAAPVAEKTRLTAASRMSEAADRLLDRVKELRGNPDLKHVRAHTAVERELRATLESWAALAGNAEVDRWRAEHEIDLANEAAAGEV